MNNFSQNLIYLRKMKSITQESLADSLEVSRQAVYKWESGQSYPEMEKIIQLSKMFEVSMDALINEDLAEAQKFSEVEAQKPKIKKEEYDKRHKLYALMIASGVLLCMVGVITLLLFGTLTDDSMLGLIIMFIIFIPAIAMFIYSGINLESIEKLRNKAEFYSHAEKTAAKKKLVAGTITAVTLCILGLLSLFLLNYILGEQDWIVCVLLGFISVGAFMFIYFGMMSERMGLDKDKDGQLKTEEDKKRNDLIGKLCGVIMVLATAVFLAISFIWDIWHISWIVFVVAALLCGVVSIWLGKSDEH